MIHLDEKKIENLKKMLWRELDFIAPFLKDKNTTEIMLNPDGEVWIDQFGQPMRCIGKMTKVNAFSFLSTVADSMGVIIDSNNPILEGELIIDGSRFEGFIPPIVKSAGFSIRKKPLKVFTFDDYEMAGTLSKEQRQILEKGVVDHKNILIVGGTSSGKTTFANAVIDKINDLTPDDRAAIIEDVPEILCNIKNSVLFTTSRTVSMQELLRVCMRVNPNRIIVGETRGQEALALLKAWNTGHSGGLATVHANSAEAGLKRIYSLVEESGINSLTIPQLILEAINYVVFMERESNGQRKLKKIVMVEDYKNNSFICETLI